jgi:ABC-2 type transport system permease protein
MTTLRAAVGLAIGFGIFHIQLVAFDPWMLLAVFAATMGALYTLGMTFASLFLLYGREAWHMCNAVQEPVFFASGLYFPIRALGAAAATVASLLPLTLGVDALRQVLLGSAARGLLPVATETAILAACTILFLGLARVALGYLERLSKREGRLTQRWQ